MVQRGSTFYEKRAERPKKRESTLQSNFIKNSQIYDKTVLTLREKQKKLQRLLILLKKQKKKERSKNAQIAIEVSKVKKRTNARTILKSYYEECLENNGLVNADLQMQRKQLEEKLMAIRKF